MVSLKSAINYCGHRLFSTRSKKLIFEEFGDPIKVIHKHEDSLSNPYKNDVLIKMLISPVNPIDIHLIQGKYPVITKLPTVGGCEGVGEIIMIGDNVKEFFIGDYVVNKSPTLGTWQTYSLINSKKLYKIPKNLGLIEAATLTINPCISYRMLKDFVQLKFGDTIIQNGANSACGQCIIQICNAWGIKTINIIRDRPNVTELKDFLKKLGATYVLTEEELRFTKIFSKNEREKPKLALNCVGRKNVLDILRHLQNDSTMVSYGEMCREPILIPPFSLIFKNLKIRGFWLISWFQKNFDSIEHKKMYDDLISMMLKKELQGPAYKFVGFDDYKEALMNTMSIKGMVGRKYLLDFNS